MARSVSEGIISGLKNYSALRGAGLQQGIEQLKTLMEMKKLQYLMGQGDGGTPSGFIRDPLTFELKPDPNYYSIPKAQAEADWQNRANQVALGGGQLPPTSLIPTRSLGISTPSLGVSPARAGQQAYRQSISPAQATSDQLPLTVKGVKSGITEYGINPVAEEQAKEIGKTQIGSAQASGEIEGMIRNLAANLKSANIEQGGAGPVRGFVGNILMKAGQPHTGNIFGLTGTLRDTSVKIAQRLSGGNRGAQLIFQKVLEGIPTNLNSEEAQATSLHDLYLTSKTLEKATKILGPEKIADMGYDGFINSLSSNALTPEETIGLTKNFSDLLSKTEPRPEFNLSGEYAPPQVTPLLKSFATKKYSENSQSLSLEQEAQQAISAGADRNSVIQRLNQLRRNRG